MTKEWIPNRTDILDRIYKQVLESNDRILAPMALEACDEIRRLRADIEDLKEDYLRRHNDATDRYIKIIEMKKDIMEILMRPLDAETENGN